MKNQIIIVLAVIGLVLPSVGKAQQSTVLDGLYRKEHAPARKVIPYAHLREGDVMWLKRVWRTIDLKQKINHTLYFPVNPINDRKSLFDVIKDAIVNEGTITAYSTGDIGTDDEFTLPMTVDEVKSMLFKMDTQYVENEFGDVEPVIQPIEVTGAEIKAYDIKEEWFFDNQRSVMDTRIIGIAPNKEKKNDDDGEVVGLQRLFWIYFPEARYVFANAEVYNPGNDAERRTFEDIFWKRQFGSFIYKESNTYDRDISEYKTGLDALLEAERIKNELFIMEHDLWHF